MGHPRPARRAVALVAFTLLTVAAGASVAGAGEGRGFAIRLLDVPSDPGGDPPTSYLIDHLDPGETIQRRVEVSNQTDATLTLALYAAAANVKDGEFRFAEGRTGNELTGWTTVRPSSVRLSGGEQAIATVTIAVASDATPGEHYGVIWAEARARGSDSGGVSVVNRVGVRMYLSTKPGGGPPSVSFSGEPEESTPEDGTGSPETSGDNPMRDSARDTTRDAMRVWLAIATGLLMGGGLPFLVLNRRRQARNRARS